jgi:hypothetical protein
LILVASVYLPSKGSHAYVDEFYDCIDQLYEIYQKYQGTHKIIIGGDLNEDLNNEKTNKRKKYLSLSLLISTHYPFSAIW